MTCVSYNDTFRVSNRLNESETFYEDATSIYVWGNISKGGSPEFGGLPGQINIKDVINIYPCDQHYNYQDHSLSLA